MEIEEPPNLCSIGSQRNQQCAPQASYVVVGDLPASNQEFLQIASQTVLSDHSTVCQIHRRDYLNRYSARFKRCCNPFGIHKRGHHKPKTHSVSMPMHYVLKATSGYAYLGRGLCKKCYFAATALVVQAATGVEAEYQAGGPQPAAPQLAAPHLAAPQLVEPQIAAPQLVEPQIAAAPQPAAPQLGNPKPGSSASTKPTTSSKRSSTFDSAGSSGFSVQPGKKFASDGSSRSGNGKRSGPTTRSRRREEDEPSSQSTVESSSPSVPWSSPSEFGEKESPGMRRQTGEVDINKIFVAAGLEPLNTKSMHLYNKRHYGKKRYKELKRVVKSKLKKVLQASVGDTENSDDASSDEENAEKAKELDSLMAGIKEKLVGLSYRKRVQLLTLVPQSWPRARVAAEFGASEYAVKHSRKLREEKGILGKPEKRKSGLSEETRKLVVEFYCHDENSRVMPGKRDCVSVAPNVYEQKRLLLGNLNELYACFRERFPDVQVSRATFCALRPKWCILAGESGTHNVCVCKIHQNVDLLLSAVGINNCTEVIDLLVCDRKNRTCMLGLCQSCPSSKNAVRDILKPLVISTYLNDGNIEQKSQESPDIFEDETSDSEELQKVEFSQWVSTDRTEIIQRVASLGELLDILCKQMKDLLPHHFIAREQSAYLSKRKENLTESEALVLMDFSENYSFVFQDEIQSLHWKRGQCTVHPVVVYYKCENELKSQSLCIISDDVKHDVSMVHLIQGKVMEFLKENVPLVTSVEYVTDGCAGQYKNCTAFYHLCNHEGEHGMKAKWTFFATSHGKSPCDACGGTVKRMAWKHCLQQLSSNFIRSAQELYNFCVKKSAEGETKIIFIFLCKDQVQQMRVTDQACQNVPVTIPGTRSFHHFEPLSTTAVACKRLSGDAKPTLVWDLIQGKSLYDYAEGEYVVCAFDEKWYVGQVKRNNLIEKEIEAVLMFPDGPSKMFSFSNTTEDLHVIPYPHVFSKANVHPLGDGYRLANTYHVKKEWQKFLENQYR